MVDDFHLMWQKWHTEVSRHIHQLAVQESLSVQSWKKNNLSDTELVLIYDYICEQRYGVDNLKQHWAAMLLTWLTAARPGSFTISSGYQKGAPLGMFKPLGQPTIAINDTKRTSGSSSGYRRYPSLV
jgi:hypothetical protein